MNQLAVFGPVPPGGTGKLPGAVLIGIGVLGLLSVPSEIRKHKSQPKARLYFVVGFDVACLVVGVVLVLMRH